MKILVVCGGNTCRSPAAEAVIRARAAEAGLDVSVSSAGIAAGTSGHPPTPLMVDLARRRGFHVTGTAHQIGPADLDGVDLVLAMDTTTRLFVESLDGGTSGRIELLGGYDDVESDEISDPFGRDRHAYEATLDRIIASTEGLIRRLSG